MIRRTVIAAVAAFAVLGASDISAQTIGFKLGASFANWNIEDENVEISTDAITSFMGGGFVRFGLGRLGFQPELLVVTRGAEFAAGDGDIFDVGRFKVDYVEVPVLLVLPLTSGMGIAPYIMGGPSFAFEIGCKIEAETGGTDVSEDCDQQGTDVFDRKSMDIGLTAGGGIEFPLGPGALLIEGRYNFGLSNIYDGESVSIKSRTPAILAGYSIPLTVR
jgi:hypothetical protein